MLVVVELPVGEQRDDAGEVGPRPQIREVAEHQSDRQTEEPLAHVVEVAGRTPNPLQRILRSPALVYSGSKNPRNLRSGQHLNVYFRMLDEEFATRSQDSKINTSAATREGIAAAVKRTRTETDRAAYLRSWPRRRWPLCGSVTTCVSSTGGGFMATAEQLKTLVRSHASGDMNQFYSVALQVAARAARNGHNKLAQDLRDLVDEAKAKSENPRSRSLRPVPATQPRGELAGLLAVSYPHERLSDLAVETEVLQRVERALAEQHQADRLREHGYHPQHRLLLIGAPGTGKTMTSRVLAGELRLPLFMIRLEVLITKFMGETAAKLRLIFDAVEETRGVYLFDEVDALAGDRSAANDVGEVRRVLNSFLQFLDPHGSRSVIVATSNHPQILDRAMFRRFDSVIEYPLPSPEIAREVMRHRLAAVNITELCWTDVDQAAKGLSHADLTLACEHAAKEAILSEKDRVTTAMLKAALRERQHVWPCA